MAVPTYGPLSMLGIAKELVHDDYNSSNSITGPIHYYDLLNGGNSAGSGENYDAINENCNPHPLAGTNSYRLLIDTSKDNTYTGGGFVRTDVYFAPAIGNAEDLAVDDQLFADADLNTTLPAGYYVQDCGEGSQYYYECSSYDGTTFNVDGEGYITEIFGYAP